MPKFSSFSVRTYVVGLIFVVVAPLLIFVAFLVYRSAQHEQDLMASLVRQRTTAAAASIDRELSALRARLFILGGSNRLQSGDFAAFHAQAQEAMDLPLSSVVLSDLSGRQLVNTAVPYGTSLPHSTDTDALDYVAATGQPYISDLTMNPATGRPMITLSIPVMRAEHVAYLLSLDIAPLLGPMLASLELPSEWLAAISDRRGHLIARSHDLERYVGQMASPRYLQRFRSAEEDWFPGLSRDGLPIYNAFAHVKLTRWVIDIGIPDQVLFAPVRHSIRVLALAGMLTAAFALLVAVGIGHRIARAITDLVAYAGRVGSGTAIGLRPTGIRETDAVAHSLYLASGQLQESAAARDQAEEGLRQSELKYRTLAQDLAVANEERTELLHRTVSAQELERKRIARELHDSLGQYLTALRLGFNAIEPLCGSSEAAQLRLTELKHLAAELGRDLNRIAWELRPMALDDLGLRRAVMQYLEEWGERSGLHIDLEITLRDRRLPQATETALFRVLQEVVTNVVKHSGADRVGVILEADESEVRLIVEDNGVGFPAETGAPAGLGTKRFGLLGMRERLALLHGTLEVESEHQHGTTVYVRIPI